MTTFRTMRHAAALQLLSAFRQFNHWPDETAKLRARLFRVLPMFLLAVPLDYSLAIRYVAYAAFMVTFRFRSLYRHAFSDRITGEFYDWLEATQQLEPIVPPAEPQPQLQEQPSKYLWQIFMAHPQKFAS